MPFMNGHKIARGWGQNEAIVHGGRQCGQAGEVSVNLVTGGDLYRDQNLGGPRRAGVSG